MRGLPARAGRCVAARRAGRADGRGAAGAGAKSRAGAGEAAPAGGDLQGLATGQLLRCEREQASRSLARAPRSPDVDSDRAAAALQSGAADEALLLLDPVLSANPSHPQALWNRALALRELGLPLAA